MAWKTSIYQKPVGIAGRQHNFIVVEDDKGNPYAEYNGGPVDGNGRFIPLDPRDLASINSRLDRKFAATIPMGSWPAIPGGQGYQETSVTADMPEQG